MRTFLATLVVAVLMLWSASANAQSTPANKAAEAVPAPAAAADAPATAPAQNDKVHNFIHWFESGGWIMWIMLAFSIVGVSIALERAVMLRRSKYAPQRLADEAQQLWRQGRHNDVAALGANSPTPLGRVIKFLAEHRTASMADVSAGATDIASAEHRRALSKFQLLSVITMASPLVGLLGTVGAMIDSFRNVVNAGKLGSATTLYSSISEALVSTQSGLLVAIPALILFHYFRNRTNAFAAQLDETSTELINEWFITPAENPAGVDGHARPGMADRAAATV